MKTIKQQMLDLIAERPGINTIEIADELNIDIEMVENKLYEPTRARVVLTELFPAPNGRTLFKYRMANAASKPPAAAPSAPRIPQFTATSRLPVAKRIETKAIAKDEVKDETPQKAMSKVDMAIAWLKENGSGSSTDLAKAMGLDTRKGNVSAFIKGAVKNGRIERDGNLWKLGTPGMPPEAPAANAEPTQKNWLTERLENRKRPATKRLKKPAHIPQSAVVSSIHLAGLQLVEWERGNFTISANDNVVDLTKEQAGVLRLFVGLTGTDGRGVA